MQRSRLRLRLPARRAACQELCLALPNCSAVHYCDAGSGRRAGECWASTQALSVPVEIPADGQRALATAPRLAVVAADMADDAAAASAGQGGGAVRMRRALGVWRASYVSAYQIGCNVTRNSVKRTGASALRPRRRPLLRGFRVRH